MFICIVTFLVNEAFLCSMVGSIHVLGVGKMKELHFLVREDKINGSLSVLHGSELNVCGVLSTQ